MGTWMPTALFQEAIGKVMRQKSVNSFCVRKFMYTKKMGASLDLQGCRETTLLESLSKKNRVGTGSESGFWIMLNLCIHPLH